MKAESAKAKSPSNASAKTKTSVPDSVALTPKKADAPKPAAQVVAKAAVKAAVKAVAKPAAKPAAVVKPVVAKAAAKPAAESQAVPAASPKVQSKAATTDDAVAPKAKAPAKAAAKPDAKNAVTAAPPAAAAPLAAKPAGVTPAPMASAPAAPVAKAGRPSSRLAQLTVPSMAQSVASTAAKASYTQIMSSSPIVSPSPSVVKKDPKLANNWKDKPVEQITDAELMAMPDGEYMNPTQMAVFRLKLVALKRDILASAGETTEHLREDTAVVPDPADRATIEEEHALELRTRDRERKLLKKIEQSIGRIDAGDYGYCDETGEAIGVGRLLARPTATLSLEAQQRRELKQKMFGD